MAGIERDCAKVRAEPGRNSQGLLNKASEIAIMHFI